eukprot:115328_1
MGLETPAFHPGYAALILVILAACASLFKPKDNYHPLQLASFDNKKGPFCLARVQYWTIRFIFYYAIPHVAVGLYLLTIGLGIGISVTRVNHDFNNNLHILRHETHELCHDVDAGLTHQLQELSDTTQQWSDQLTWFLIAYFFQKMFGATLLVNGGASVLIGALIFDPWLFVSTFWGTNIENNFLSIVNTASMDKCLSEWDNDHRVFDSFEDVVHALNNVNICLWTMFAMSLSAGLVIDIVCTSIREFEYCLKHDLKDEDAIWNKLNVVGDAVDAIEDAVEEVLEDAGLKDDSSEEEEQEDTETRTAADAGQTNVIDVQETYKD